MPDGEVTERRWTTDFRVTRKSIRDYCSAVGESNQIFTNPRSAIAAGYADVIAPPMFAAVYSLPALHLMLADPEFARVAPQMLHAGQTFVWNQNGAVVADDVITTTASVGSVTRRRDLTFFKFRTLSVRSDGLETSRGEWTTIVREA